MTKHQTVELLAHNVVENIKYIMCAHCTALGFGSLLVFCASRTEGRSYFSVSATAPLNTYI